MASNMLRSTTTLILILCVLVSTSIALVLDTDGVPLRNNGLYYIIPQNTGIGGGLTLTSKKGDDSSSCPLHITRDNDETSPGIPVTISSPYRIAIITTSLPITIVFKDKPNICKQRLGWQVVPDSTGQSYVTTGGRGTFLIPTEVFTIQNSEGNNVYKLHLPSVDNDVGFFSKDGLLGITTDIPLPVVFRKASDDVLAMTV